jgi:hypothetical protein
VKALINSVITIVLSTAAIQAETVTLESLLNEMVNRDRLARTPEPAYRCRQFSSYDRASTSPDKKETWFANGDQGQFVRTETRDGRKESVLLDAKGPGAIVRFWATWHTTPRNTLRVYIDGNPAPAIEGPMADLIDGGLLVLPPLGQGVSPHTEYDRRGHNLYLPIPYAKSCKITYEEPRKGPFYYQINYRTYAAGTPVEPFTMEGLALLRPLIGRVQRDLSLSRPPQTSSVATLPGTRLEPGTSLSTEIEGPAAIRELSILLAAGDPDQALRSTVLEIAFDGDRTVWCPAGDFFGTGHQFHAYRSWYTTVTPAGAMTCYWTMPFRESCRVTLHNLGDQLVHATLCDIRTGAWTWDERSMHFHATWRQLTKVETQSNTDADHGAFDVNYVTVKGQGVYAGDTLTLFNGASAWWGEGDEKIFVDGEAFPSHFGTGTEDYYGYAWCHRNPFEAPFHAQPTGAGNNTPGMSVNSRYRALDAIPFTSVLQVDMELWHWKKTVMNYAPATFWYARPGATCNVAPDPESAALPIAREQDDLVEVYRIPGAIEAEKLAIAKRTGGATEEQTWREEIWSRGVQVWWTQAKPNDRLAFRLPVERAGRYTIASNLTKAEDYAVVAVVVNGEVLQEALDLYNPEVIAEMIRLGETELVKGDNAIEFRIVGANDKAEKRFMVGVDCFVLEGDEE